MFSYHKIHHFKPAGSVTANSDLCTLLVQTLRPYRNDNFSHPEMKYLCYFVEVFQLLQILMIKSSYFEFQFRYCM